MRRWWMGACCWIVGSHAWIFSPGSILSAQQVASPPASVIRVSPLPGEVEAPVVTAMAVTADGVHIAVAGDDHSIRLLDAADGRSIAMVRGHRDWVRGLVFSPGGRRLASCGHDGAVRVWEIAPDAGGVRLLADRIAEHAVFGLAFASENELYAVGFSDAVYRWNVAEDDWRIDHRCDCNDLRAIDISKDGRWLAYGGRDGIIRVHPLIGPDHVLAGGSPPSGSHHLRSSPNLHYDRILSIRFSDDGKSLYSCGEDRRLVQWEQSSNRVLAGMDVQAGKLMATCPLENGLVAVTGTDNTIRIVDLPNAKSIAKLVGHDGSVAVLHRTATHLFSGGFDTTVRTWNIEESLGGLDHSGRFVHPISAQFEDSSSQEPIR